MDSLKRTPLYSEHARLGAKFTPFAGYDMPVLYSGVIEEHRAVRSGVGIFDVSHMGEVFCAGPDATSFLQRLTCNDLGKIGDGRAQYTILTNESGGAVDDIIIYRRGPSDYLVCVNAANVAKDFAWMMDQRRESAVELANRSEEYAQIAVQGPHAESLLGKLYPEEGFDRSAFPFFSFREIAWSESNQVFATIVARTGYTGEDGFEVFLPNDAATPFWRSLLEGGAVPCGLGARDTLRLEAALPLYGHELRDDINIAAANVAWTIKVAKGEFNGRGPIADALTNGTTTRLCGLEVLDPGIVRDGAPLSTADGREIGFVTSGTKTPTLNKAIALAYLSADLTGVGAEVFATVRDRRLRARVVSIPFYRRERPA